MNKSLIAKLLSNDSNLTSESLQNFFFSVRSLHQSGLYPLYYIYSGNYIHRYNLIKILKGHFNKQEYDKSL